MCLLRTPLPRGRSRSLPCFSQPFLSPSKSLFFVKYLSSPFSPLVELHTPQSWTEISFFAQSQNLRGPFFHLFIINYLFRHPLCRARLHPLEKKCCQLKFRRRKQLLIESLNMWRTMTCDVNYIGTSSITPQKKLFFFVFRVLMFNVDQAFHFLILETRLFARL